MGFTVKLVRPVKSKITRFAPFASVTQAGFVNVVKADWNKDFFEELESLDFKGKLHDDQADALADLWLLLAKKMLVPEIKINPTRSIRSTTRLGNRRRQ